MSGSTLPIELGLVRCFHGRRRARGGRAAASREAERGKSASSIGERRRNQYASVRQKQIGRVRGTRDGHSRMEIVEGVFLLAEIRGVQVLSAGIEVGALTAGRRCRKR